jgi:predicted metal-dependent hydrolase
VTPSALERALVQAAELFRAGRFFETHEVLEDAWRMLTGERRVFVQGLIQVAAGFHHLARRKPKSAVTLFARGRAKLVAASSDSCGVDAPLLLGDLGAWEAAAAAGRWDDALALQRFVVRLPDGRRFGC